MTVARPDTMLETLSAAGADWRVGVERGRAVRLPDGPRASLVLAGMGGSAIAGDLVAACVSDHGAAFAPVRVVRGYRIAPRALEGALFVASSYSGATEETLAAIDTADRAPDVVIASGGPLAQRAHANGWPVVELPGGRPPRASLYVTWAALLAIAHRAGIGSLDDADMADAERVAEDTARRNAPGAPEDGHAARALAQHLTGGVPLLIATTPACAAVATRWKGELHENAKAACIATELPEMDHNEIVGATARPGVTALRAVCLRDPADEHPRVALRAQLTRELLEEAGVPVRDVAGRGAGRVARLVSLCVLGDHASVYLAMARGVDATPTPILDRIKQTLRSASP